MAANCVAARQFFPHHQRVGQRHFADRKERRLGAKLVERIEDRFRHPRHRTVVKRQNDLIWVQERGLVGLFGKAAEDRPSTGVDLDRAGYANTAAWILAVSARASYARQQAGYQCDSND